MTVETPQPRDRVRWQRTRAIEGVVEEITSDGLNIRAEDGRLHLCQVEDATVEVLERADDPSKDLPGVLRREEHDGGFVLYAKGADAGTAWVVVSSSALQLLGRRFEDEFVAEFPRAGAVPGTPAAEADPETQMREVVKQMPQVGESVEQWQERTAHRSVRVENTPDGLSIPDRQTVADLLVAGKPAAAVEAARKAGLDHPAADAYVRQMPEYETYLNHHGGQKREMCTRDDCPGGTRCSSGATVWHDKTPDCEELTEVDPTEAARMRAMGFDKQPEVQISDEDRALIASVLEERMGEYFRDTGYGYRLNTDHLDGVVADIVWAAIRRDRERGDR